MSSFPSVVEIEINSNCNLACSYCPNSVSERKEKGEMDKSIFEEIIRQLVEVNYRGKIAFDFYNEPTLSKNFLQYTKYIRSKLPLVFMELYTNGTKILTQQSAARIIESGFNKVIVTKHEAIKVLKFEEVFNSLSAELQEKFELRSEGDLNLTNRGGILTEIYDKGGIKASCEIPSLIMTITVNGNVLPCFEDFHQTQAMGNMMKQSLSTIWNSEKYVKFRTDLKLKHREKYEICKNCNRVSEKIMKEKTEKHLLDDEEIAAVSKIIKSGKLFRYKDDESECRKFEIEFSKKIGVKHSQLVNSGTNALLAALMCSDIGPGDEVIIPAYTFVATATAVLNSGAIPIIANIDEKLGISTEEIKKLISPRTKAIIPVHMDGISCDIEAVVKLAKEKNLIVIEDVCQAIGAKLNGKYLGTFGDFGCYSLNMDKVITTGEGGIVISNNRKDYEKLLCISDAGFPFGEGQTKTFEEITPFLGMSMRISEITGAIARVQLKKLDKIISEHRSRKELFLNQLEPNDVFKILRPYNHGEDCGIKLHFIFNNPLEANKLGKLLRDEKILLYPPFIRRAHVAWQWIHMLGELSEINQKRNPYNLTNIKYTYSKASFGTSINTIMSTLIFDIDLSLNENEIIAIAGKINQLAKSISND